MVQERRRRSGRDRSRARVRPLRPKSAVRRASRRLSFRPDRAEPGTRVGRPSALPRAWRRRVRGRPRAGRVLACGGGRGGGSMATHSGSGCVEPVRGRRPSSFGACSSDAERGSGGGGGRTTCAGTGTQGGANLQVPDVEPGKFNVAMVLIGPHDDGGWSQAHYEGLQYLCKNMADTPRRLHRERPRGRRLRAGLPEPRPEGLQLHHRHVVRLHGPDGRRSPRNSPTSRSST